MVLNDFREDIKAMVAERGQLQSDVAYAMGMSRQLFDARVKWATVSKGYKEVCEILGYDIEVKYVVSKAGGRLLNNTSKDLVMLMKQSGRKAEDVAHELGTLPTAVYNRARHGNMSRGIMEILEYLGYDVEYHYIRR